VNSISRAPPSRVAPAHPAVGDVPPLPASLCCSDRETQHRDRYQEGSQSAAYQTSSGRSRRARAAYQRAWASRGDTSGYQGVDITGNRAIMGDAVNGCGITILGWATTVSDFRGHYWARVHVVPLVPWNRDESHNSRAGHPDWQRCSSVRYTQYLRSSRLVSRAPRSGIYATHHGSRGLARRCGGSASMAMWITRCDACASKSLEGGIRHGDPGGKRAYRGVSRRVSQQRDGRTR
jgi:hypothetical protein